MIFICAVILFRLLDSLFKYYFDISALARIRKRPRLGGVSSFLSYDLIRQILKRSRSAATAADPGSGSGNAAARAGAGGRAGGDEDGRHEDRVHDEA